MINGGRNAEECASLGVVGAVAAASLISISGPASAATYRPPAISYVSPVNVPDGTDATVLVSYRCYGGGSTHAWVSAKQGPKIKEGRQNSSADAVSWYDTNWNYGPGNPNGKQITCNGKWQNELFVLKSVPGFKPLKTGWGFVQVCFYDSTADLSDETSTKGFGYNYQVHHVYVQPKKAN